MTPCPSCGSRMACSVGCRTMKNALRAVRHTWAAGPGAPATGETELDDRARRLLGAALEAFRERVRGAALGRVADEVVGAVEAALGPYLSTGGEDAGPVEVPPTPPPSDGYSAGAPMPQEVAAYRARGRDEFLEAVDCWRAWQRTGSSRPLADYLEANVAPARYLARRA